MVGNSEKNRYKLDYFSSFFCFFLGLKNWNVRCIWNVLLKMEKNTVVELGRNYETNELKPFLHQQWIYISEKNEQGEIETKKN